MLVIRLSRTGAKKRPFYHIVAIDSRRARDSGNFVEQLGYFNPVARGGELKLNLNHDRINYWLEQGGQLSPRVKSLIYQSQRISAGLTTHAEKKAQRKAKNNSANQTATTESHSEGSEKTE